MPKYTLDVEPMPAPRPRVRLAGKIPMAYYPSAYNNWRDAVANLLTKAREGMVPIEGPVAVTIHVRCTKPRTSKLQFPRPDADNYAKSILDACTKAGVWWDDAQVVNLAVFKRWSRPNEPRILIEITRLESHDG